jgi:hypothetical protein
MDKRLGRRDREGALILAPEQTISGRPVETVYSTIGLGDGYFAVLDLFLKDAKRDEYVVELQEIIRSAAKKPAKVESAVSDGAKPTD